MFGCLAFASATLQTSLDIWILKFTCSINCHLPHSMRGWTDGWDEADNLSSIQFGGIKKIEMDFYFSLSINENRTMKKLLWVSKLRTPKAF